MANTPGSLPDNDKSGEKDPMLDIELGGTGTIIVGGIIRGQDYNNDLVGVQGIKEYDKMRLGDATVNASLEAIKLPIRSANWFVQAASEDARDKEIADFVEYALFEQMEYTWNDWLREALNYLDWGRMVFEKVWTMDENGMIVLKKMAPRLPITIYAWQQMDGSEGITQFLPTGGYREMPWDKLVVLVNKKEGDNWEGRSILRTAYKNWYMKDRLYQIEGMSIERQGVGIPVIHLPENATPQDEAKAEELARNLRVNEEAFIVTKGDKLAPEMMDMKASQVRDPQKAILHHDRQISKNILAQFIELGGTGGGQKGGSYALSKSQTDLFLLSLQATARHIAEAVNKYVVKEMVDFNFDNVEEYPTLSFSKVGQEDMDLLSNFLQRAGQTGFLTPDPTLESYIRETFDLPPLPEGALEEKNLNDLLRKIESIGQQSPLSQAGQGGTVGEQPPESGIPLLHGSDSNEGADSAYSTKYKKLTADLQQAAIATRLELAKRKLAGDKLTADDFNKLHVDLLTKHQQWMAKTAKLQASEHNPHIETIMSMKERIDHALTKVERKPNKRAR